jgi:pimeloyl-ACP methyl ester carboxylesterase
MDRPRVVLVHGSFCAPGLWDPLVVALQATDLPWVRADLPTMRSAGATLADDVDHVRELAGTGRSILCGHSYGGAVITEAAPALPGVGHLLYLASVLPGTGETMLDWMVKRPTDGSPLEFHDDGTATVTAWGDDDGERYPAEVVELFQRNPPRPFAVAAAVTPIGTAGWRTLPSTAVVATRDTVLHPDTQREAAARAGRTLEMDSDHLVFGTRPRAIADLLEEIAADV